MYERSAIVLEKYYNNIFGFNQKINLKVLYKNYKEMMEEIQKYQSILEEEDKIIIQFDEVANKIRNVQQEQKKIYKENIKLEEQRNQLFDSLDEEPSIIEEKLKKIEEITDKNNKRLQELRTGFIEALTKFSDKQKERNKYSRARRTEEKEYIKITEKAKKDIDEIDINVLKNIKRFYNSENDEEKNEIIEIMVNNGKDEKVEFSRDVIEDSVNIRNKIAKDEAFCYMTIYDRTKKILSEVNGDEIKLDKYQKVLRDASVKLSFLAAKKNYIVSFLDNERMTAIYGPKVHKKLMAEACENFELDMEQFDNLYELILREISGKATKKVYKELYNKEYLKSIKEKERKFEREINSIKINAGTIINSNYWRIEEIKNIYEVFQKEVSEKFEKDLSEFKLEVVEEPEEIVTNFKVKKEVEDDIFRTEISDDDIEYIEEYEYDEDDYEDNYDEEDDDEYDEADYEEDYEEDDEDKYEEEDNYDEYDEVDYEDDYEDDNDDNYEDDDYEEFEDDDYEEFEEDDYEDEYDEEDDDDDFEDEDDYEEDDDYDYEQDKSKKGKSLFNKFFKDKKD